MDVPRLLTLLSILYPPPSQHLPSQLQQSQAQRELFDAIADPSTWGLATRVLDACGVEDWAEDPNARFFAAHAVAIKTSRDWSSLSEDHHVQLKDKLLQWLATSARRAYPPDGRAGSGPERVVLRKLSVATATLSFKLVPSPPGTWKNWLLEVISSINAPPAPSRQAVLECLTVIAEEAERADLVGSRRVQYDQSLADAGGIITTTLVDSLSPSDSPSIKALALRCAQAWLSSSHLSSEAPTALWPLLLTNLTSLQAGNEDVVARAADCVEELLGGAGSSSGFAMRGSRSEVLLDWFAGPELGAVLENAVSTGEVEDAVLALVKLFVSLTETCMQVLAGTLTSQRTLTLLQRLLQLTTFPGYFGVDEHVSALPLPLWTLLQEELLDSGELEDSHDNGPLDAAKVGVEIFSAVAEGLKNKARWPTEAELVPENGWTSDVVKGFRVARVDVGECVLACYYVLRGEVLRKWVEEVERLVGREQGPGECYEDLEAVLHCVKVVHEGIPLEESTYLPRLFGSDTLQRIPSGSRRPLLRLRYTVLGIVAEYADWFKGRSTELLAALDFVVPHLSSPDMETISLAATALRRLCDEGRKVLIHHIAPLAHIIQSTEGRLPVEEYRKVLQSVVSVLQAMPAAGQAAPVCSLVDPILARLEQALPRFLHTRSEEDRDLILVQLGLLKGCSKGLAEPEEEMIVLDGPDVHSQERIKANELVKLPEIVALRTRMANVMSAAISCSAVDSGIALATTDVLRECTTGELPTALSMDPFPTLLSVVTTASADQSRASIWFSLATSLVVSTRREKGRNLNDAEGEALVGCVRQCTAIASAMLGTEQQLKEEPDVMQSFLHLCVAITHHFVHVFELLRSELETITVIAIRSLVVEECVALQAALGLISLFIQQTRSQAPSPELFRQLIAVHGPMILHRIVAGIGGALPRSALASLAEVLHSAVLRLPDQTRLWLKEMFEQPGFPSDKVSADRKARFVTSICGARTLKRARDICTEFATVARGLEGSAYGASVLSLTL